MHSVSQITWEPFSISRAAGHLTISVHDYTKDLPKHAFPWAYLVLVSRGDYQQTANGRSYECKQGTLLVQPAGYSHSTRFGASGARCIAIQLNAPQGDDPAIQRLLSDHRRMSIPDACRLQRRIERELIATDAAAGLALQASVLELIAEACRRTDRPSTREPEWLVRVRERLHDTPRETPALQELAKLAGVHPTYLAQRFHQAHGMSVGEYLRRLRVEHAREALAVTSEPIATIAVDAGFADQSHFTRVFHRLTGETPLAWRRRTRSAS